MKRMQMITLASVSVIIVGCATKPKGRSTLSTQRWIQDIPEGAPNGVHQGR